VSPSKIEVKFNDRTEEARDKLADIMVDAIREVLEGRVLPEAKAASPVGHEPVKSGEKRNRDSLEVKAFITKKGNPFGKIFSTSGHGGILEMGYTHVGGEEIAGRPYIYPALQAHVAEIPEIVKAKVGDAVTSTITEK